MLNSFIFWLVLAQSKSYNFPMETMYPSGVKVGDSSVYKGPHSTKLPVLALSYYIKSADEKIVTPGHYLVKISDDDRYLLFLQNNKIICFLKILKTIELEEPVRLNSVVAKAYKGETLLIITKQASKEAHSMVEIGRI